MKNKEIEDILKNIKYAIDEDDYWEVTKETLIPLLSYIEQLGNLCNKYEQEHKTTFEIWKKDIKKLKQLENNRDKAIEYFKFENPEIFKNPKYTNHLWTIDGLTIKRFIDKLKGGSDD